VIPLLKLPKQLYHSLLLVRFGAVIKLAHCTHAVYNKNTTSSKTTVLSNWQPSPSGYQSNRSMIFNLSAFLMLDLYCANLVPKKCGNLKFSNKNKLRKPHQQKIGPKICQIDSFPASIIKIVLLNTQKRLAFF